MTHTRAPAKHCPFCDERISLDAKKCRFCGEILDPFLAELRHKQPQTLTPQTAKKTIASAAVICWFLGCFGAHRFYVGRTGSAVTMLVLSLTIVGLVVTIPCLRLL